MSINYYGGNALEYQLLAFVSAYGLIVLVLIILSIIAGWKIFKKAGQPGWASIVPFYDNYIEYKIYWGNGWLFLLPVILGILSCIPVIGALFTLAAFIMHVMTQYKKAEAFGERIGFTIGLILLPTIFHLILGFGHYEYHGIPMDGVSYKDIKGKYDEINKKNVNFEKPVETEQKPVEYEQPAKPEEKPMEYDAPKVETEEIKPAEEPKDENE
jgi:hypothetical protein